MTPIRSLTAALILVAVALPPNPAAAEAGGWYVAPGVRVVKLEGWQEGYGRSLTVGWKLPYRHDDRPRSSVALEADVADTTDALSRRRDGARQRADMRHAGGYLALNTYVNDRVFHHVRFGAVLREQRGPGGDGVSGRLVFGLGLGARVTERLEVLARAQTQFWDFPEDLLHEGTASLRWHF